MIRQSTPGRAWAQFGFAFGILVSVAANVAHSYVPPEDAPADWQPDRGTIAAAAFWPIALVVSIEVISRVQWQHGWHWRALRFGGAALVALVAAIISYKHLNGLLLNYGEDQLSAAIGPLAVDGLMTICSAAMLATSSRHTEPRSEPSTEPEPTPSIEPADEPEPAPARHEAKRPSRRIRLTGRRTAQETETLVAQAHQAHPDVTNERLAEITKFSLATVKRYRPKRAVSQAPEPPVERVNGHTPDLEGATGARS